MEEIPRLSDPAPGWFRRAFVAEGRPAILVGVADRWPAVRRWTRETLEALAGDEQVDVQIVDAEGRRRAWMRFAECLRVLDPGEGPSGVYMQGIDVRLLGEAARGDVGDLEPFMGLSARYPSALRRHLLDVPRLWIGPTHTVSPVHFDLAHNLFVQLVGRKRFTLFDPAQSPLLHYPDYEQAGVQFCGIDVEQPDLERYPRFRAARPRVVDLGPGEILFLPHSWWHHVRSLDPSISLSTWWLTPRMILEQRSYWYHRLRREFTRAAAESDQGRRSRA